MISQCVWIALLVTGLVGLLPNALCQNQSGRIPVMTTSDRLLRDLTADLTGALPYTGLGPVTVDLYLSLHQILELDGQKQTLTLVATLSMLWWDMHLQWNASDYDGYEDTALPASAVWVPPIGLYNSVSQSRDPDWEKLFPVFVHKDGLVGWSVFSTFSFSCTLDMTKFPFDTQECQLEFTSIVYDSRVLNLSSPGDHIFTDWMIPNKEFDLITTGTWRSDLVAGEWSVAKVNFGLTLRRKPTFYVLTLLLPCLVLSIVALLVFMVPTEAGEKLSLSITVLLSFSVFLLILSDNVPRASEQVPLLGIYLAIVIVINGLALFCTVLILNVYHIYPLRPMPGWLYRGIVLALGKCLKVSKETTLRDTPHQNRISPKVEDLEDNWVKDGERMETCRDDGQDRKTDKASIKAHAHPVVMTENDAEKDEELRELWRTAARVLDRFFLVLYSVVVLMIIVGMIINPMSA